MYFHDDIAIHTATSYSQNIDYLSKEEYLQDNYNLFKCLNYDNERISNVCWRRIYKNLHGLEELNPLEINWDKVSDITWLYGPKFDTKEIVSPEIIPDIEEDDDEGSDYADDIFDNSDASSMSLIDSGYYADYTPSIPIDKVKKSKIINTEESYSPRGIIKAHGARNVNPKKVVFNFKINQREIINGIIFDYDILDEDYL